jgi:hypothetical protein
VVPPETTRAIGRKLGGAIERLTNSVVRVYGQAIKLNAITAVDEAGAKAIHASLGKIKSYPFCMRKGKVVIEYVATQDDAALAIKTSYELGLEPRPERIRYRVVADLAAIDRADYMACNPLFNQFLALQGGMDQGAAQQIKVLAARFQFGRTLVLRNPKLDNEPADHRFRPPATGAETKGPATAYTFEELPTRQAVPYVTATLELTANATGLTASTEAPGNALTAATPFWPADDPKVIALARRITAGQTTNEGKAAAIQKWLTPGSNIRYAGQTGSRWGTQKVLEQKFGHCWDFSDCFVTLARAAGVPSRQVAGWLYGTSGHVWAEYYREGKGWQQVDPTGGDVLRCGIYHLAYFTSEDGEMPIVYLSMPAIEIVQAK